MHTLSTNAGGSDDAEDIISPSSNNGASEVTVEDVIDAAIVRSPSGSSEKIDGEEPNPTVESALDASISRSSSILEINKTCYPHCRRISTTIMFLDYATIKPQLIGINIQARAVQNTKQSLLSSLPSDIYHDHVQVLEQSHEHLKVPRDLGYLPGA